MSLKRDITKVFCSNSINLLIGIVTVFLVPAFLSLNQYANLKLFTLYTSYIGILHFGFIDGLYIKYGGKKEEELDKVLLKEEHKFLFLFQLVITIIFLLLGGILRDYILITFSLAIIPINMQTFFNFLYQALREFSKYSKIVIITSNLLLITNLFNIYILKINSFWPFIIGTLLVYYIVFLGLEINFFKKFKKQVTFKDGRNILNNFRVGIFIMLGNLSFVFFYSIDRWFVKFIFSLNIFAFYSFAISMMTVLNTLISSLTMTLYPHLVQNRDETSLKKIKAILLMTGTLATGGYFVFTFIVKLFMKKYAPSLDLIAILFAGFPAIIVINALYVNLYKAQKQEKLYFSTVFKMLLITTILNSISIIIYRKSQNIALATTISFYVWYLYSAKHFKMLKISFKEAIYLLLFLSIFFITTNYFSWWQGAFVYFISVGALNLAFYSEEIRRLIKGNLESIQL